MKYIRQAFLLTVGISLTSLLFSQTPVNGSVQARPVANSAVTTSAPATGTLKPATAVSGAKKVKTVDKKKRKPAQVTTVKKNSFNTPKSVK